MIPLDLVICGMNTKCQPYTQLTAEISIGNVKSQCCHAKSGTSQNTFTCAERTGFLKARELRCCKTPKIRGVTVGWQAHPSLTWCPVFLLEVGSISSLSLLTLLLGISSKVPVSPGSLSPLWCTLHRSPPPPPPISWSCLHSFCWPSGLQSFSLTQYQIKFPFPLKSHPLSIQGPSLPPHLWLLSSPSQVGLRHPHLDPSACWPLWVLWTIYRVFCTYFFGNIHLLVSTCHACPFVSELPWNDFFF
jgi:hypothetical protein